MQNLQTTSSDTEQASAFEAAAAGADAAAMVRSATAIPQQAGRARQADRPAAKQETVVKDEWSKTGRNAPCPCGSGKKFKICHGAA